MISQELIVKNLEQFNNQSFTKQQWEIILQGCGCPKSPHFWKALKQNNLEYDSYKYTLIDMDIHSYAIILEEYRRNNRMTVKKYHTKIKRKKEAINKAKRFRGILFYMVDGVLTTENPNL